jgi:putative redox protein
MPRVVARRRDGFTHEVEIEGGHSLILDEPAEKGGNDRGPTPVRTVAAALAACTAITVEMYAANKGWELGAVEVEASYEDDGKSGASSFAVTLRVPETLDDEQRAKLVVIAGKCPVHRLIAGETPVEIVDRIEQPGD